MLIFINLTLEYAMLYYNALAVLRLLLLLK